jgi:hypothetical protein
MGLTSFGLEGMRSELVSCSCEALARLWYSGLRMSRRICRKSFS